MSPRINGPTVNIKDKHDPLEMYDSPLPDDLHRCQANLIIHAISLAI